MATLPFILLLLPILLPILANANPLMSECLTINLNSRYSHQEPNFEQDADTLMECHGICRETGYEVCAAYVFNSRTGTCRLYTEEQANRLEIKSQSQSHTLVLLTPDCVDDSLMERQRRATNVSYTGGQWADWQAWTSCSATCGSGQQQRKRVCKTYQPCPGNNNETQTCSGPPCVKWADWAPWGKCSVLCGGGTRVRTRACPSYGGCGDGAKSENATCNPQTCCTNWSQWKQCSVTCGEGTRVRTQRCMVDAPNAPGGYASQEKSETGNCTMPECATWMSWEPWTDCSTTCGGGNQTRKRVCTVLDKCKGPCDENQQCSPDPCPNWSTWGEWTPCSDTCGGGWQIRVRNCTAGDQPSDQCPGDNKEKQLCNTYDCPYFGQWQEWSQCTVTCGGGTRVRDRQCVSDATFCTDPANGGNAACGCQDTDGTSNVQSNETCSDNPCPDWTPWGEWGPCSDTCGGGWQVRERKCLAGDQLSTDCPGDDKEKQICNDVDCPAFQEWQEWSICSVTCGNGTKTRTRTCTTDADYCTGDNSTAAVCKCTDTTTETSEDPSTDTDSCDAGPCYTWSSWSEWGECTTLCGGGSRSRARQCPLEGGCPGLTNDSDICNMMPCPDWGEWSPYSDCSVTCGGGQRSRTRSCPLPKACTPGEEYEMDPESCSPDACPVWSDWQPWSTCSKTCGEGNRKRTRQCQGGDGCLGSGENIEPCFDKPCTLSTNWSQWSPCTATCGGGTQTRSRVTCPAGPPTCPIEEGTQPCNPQACPQWAEWGAWGDCSKSCGGGQRVRTRTCPVTNGCVGATSDIDPTPCNSFGCSSGR